jgi:phosphoadenosine phosphosulfate reductase
MNSLRVAINTAVNLLSIVRGQTDAIGVSVSFGKDSMVTLDLCCKIFKRVEAFYLFRVANLSVIKKWQNYVKKRYGINVEMYPHFDLSRCYRNNILQPHYRNLGKKVPKITWNDTEHYFRVQKKVDWLAYGWRRNDSFSRALIMKSNAGYDEKSRRVFPLRAFSRTHVYEYLDKMGIPRPPDLGRKEQSGFDFNPDAIQYLKKNNPNDYKKWIRDFPFSDMPKIAK